MRAAARPDGGEGPRPVRRASDETPEDRWLTVVVEPEPAAPPVVERRPVSIAPPVRVPWWRRAWIAAAGVLVIGGMAALAIGSWLLEESGSRWDGVVRETTAAARDLGDRSRAAAAALAGDLDGLEDTAATLGEVSAALEAASRIAADLEAVADGGAAVGPEGVEVLMGGIGRLAGALDAAFPGLAEVGVAGPEGPGGALLAAARALIDAFGVPVPDPLTGFGPFVLQDPLPGSTVTDGFGTERGGRFHGGVDLAAPAGTPILAADDGEVLQAGWLDDAAGIGVILRHAQGWETRYFHMQSTDLPVSAGDRVAAGQVIGAVGSTGESTGPHLHFEIVYGPIRLDPQDGFVFLDGTAATGAGEAPPAAGVTGAAGSGREAGEPGETALTEAPGAVARVRRDLTALGADAVALASTFEAQRAEEQRRRRDALVVLAAGAAAVLAGAALWWRRPEGAR